jgi:micrococcal nuclease
LIGIDTPEVYGGVECFGEEAAAFAERVLVPGTEVYVLAGTEPRDRYGRLLAYVWLADGRFFNALVLARGYGTPLTIAPNDDHASLFRRLSRRARRQGRGLWSASACRGRVGGRGSRTRHGAQDGPSAGASAGADKDCSDFSGHAEAQRYYRAKDGPSRDPDRLDADHDGLACE